MHKIIENQKSVHQFQLASIVVAPVDRENGGFVYLVTKVGEPMYESGKEYLTHHEAFDAACKSVDPDWKSESDKLEKHNALEKEKHEEMARRNLSGEQPVS